MNLFLDYPVFGKAIRTANDFLFVIYAQKKKMKTLTNSMCANRTEESNKSYSSSDNAGNQDCSSKYMTRKKREANFELLRIIAMIMVITIHATLGSGIFVATEKYEFNYAFSVFLKSISTVAVNCYILLSGYFLCRSIIRAEKIFTIYLQTLYYSMFYFLLNLFFSLTDEYSTGELLLHSLFPVSIYWFFMSYLMVLILSPFLNIIIQTMNRKQFVLLLSILFFVVCVVPSCGYDLFHSYGFPKLLLFIELYFTGAFCRNYVMIKPENWKKPFRLLILFFSLTFLLHLINFITNKRYGFRLFKCEEYHFVLNYGIAVYLFLLFGCIRIHSKWLTNSILFLSPLTFGVYLFHENLYIRYYLWNHLFSFKQYYTSYWFSLYLIATILTVYIFGSAFDYIRLILFQKLQIRERFAHSTICRKLNSIWEKSELSLCSSNNTKHNEHD